MKKLLLTLAVAGMCCVMAVGGCVPNYYRPSYTPYTPTTPQKKDYQFDKSKSAYNDSKISVSLSERCNPYTGSVEGFVLNIENKTHNDMNLVWNETYYLSNNTVNGGFMFEGIVYSRRTDPKQDLILLPNTKQEIVLFPNALVDYMPPPSLGSSVLPGGWSHQDIGTGEYGAYIKIRGKGIDKRIKLTLNITY